MEPMEIETPAGLARAEVEVPQHATHALVLGHGAGGGFAARDLVAAADAARALGFAVALVEQPYRVAGRRSPAPAAQLDAAWIAALEQLTTHELQGLRLVTGGRSSGARVACRTAAATHAAGVLCLAFPVHPPGRPDKSRLPELDTVTVPVLVVQGTSDPFGMPPPAGNRTVVQVNGDHSLRGGLAELGEAVREWLPKL
jgi:uncharacterized protein